MLRASALYLFSIVMICSHDNGYICGLGGRMVVVGVMVMVMVMVMVTVCSGKRRMDCR